MVIVVPPSPDSMWKSSDSDFISCRPHPRLFFVPSFFRMSGPLDRRRVKAFAEVLDEDDQLLRRQRELDPDGRVLFARVFQRVDDRFGHQDLRLTDLLVRDPHEPRESVQPFDRHELDVRDPRQRHLQRHFVGHALLLITMRVMSSSCTAPSIHDSPACTSRSTISSGVSAPESRRICWTLA